METVNKYLINEGRASQVIKKAVEKYQKEEMKLAQKFSKEIQKVIGGIYDLESLENFRDGELRNLAISSELEYALDDAIEAQIMKIYKEEM